MSTATTPRIRQPKDGQPFLYHAAPGGVPEWRPIEKILRQTDDGHVWTIQRDSRILAWVRWDAVRAAWVNAVCERDGGPVVADEYLSSGRRPDAGEAAA